MNILMKKTGKPTGTLRIPAFLKHCDRYVDSRSILKRSCEYVKEELMKLLQTNQVKGMEFIDANEIADVIFTSATELEFWVKTPSRNVDAKALPYLKNYKSNTGNVLMAPCVQH